MGGLDEKNHDHAAPTKQELERALGLIMDQIAALKTDQPHAIAAAIREVLTDTDTWHQIIDTASRAAETKATTAAGRGFLWLLRNAFSKAIFVALVTVLVAKMFGWDVAAKVGKWLSAA